MSLVLKANSIWSHLLELAECGNINCKSDLQVKLINPDVVKCGKKMI